MHLANRLLCFFILVVFLFGCKEDFGFYQGQGKRPLYLDFSELGDIKSMPPRAVQEAGVIYMQDSLLFMVEQYQGIHVFNVADTANPQNLVFVQIPAVTDFTLNNTLLIADNGPNMATINIADIYNVKVLSVTPGVFQPVHRPPMFMGPFECVDNGKGVVVGWEDIWLDKANCFAN